MSGPKSFEPLSPPEPATLLSELLARRAEFSGFLLAKVHDPAVAEDILQAAYVRTLEKNEQIRNAESITAWFYRILRNALTDHYRRNAARTRAHEEFAAGAATSYELELEANLCGCVSGVVQTLKPEYRTALERIDLGGASVTEFAQMEGTTPNNASVRLHRARRAAAKKLSQICGACAEHKCLDCTCKRKV